MTSYAQVCNKLHLQHESLFLQLNRSIEFSTNYQFDLQSIDQVVSLSITMVRTETEEPKLYCVFSMNWKMSQYPTDLRV